MRTALIAALRHGPDGRLRAVLPLAGRSVLARQAELLRAHGCERILCLCDAIDPEILRVQAQVEGEGATFQALRGFLHLPALVRAEDDLVILADGLVPDPASFAALFDAAPPPPRFVACLPEGSPLVAAHPEDFERIDADRHWAGVLAMRGAPVQHLADFPPDADAVSVLLRLALQAGTPCRELPEAAQRAGKWLVADDAALLAEQEKAMIRAAVPPADWHAPTAALAGLAARRMAPRGLDRGPELALALAGVLLLGGALGAGRGMPALGLGLAAGGALAAALSGALGALRSRLLGARVWFSAPERAGWLVDGAGMIIVWLALSPLPRAAPLAMLGPVAVALGRLVTATAPGSALAPLADRAVLLALFALAAGLGLLSHGVALAALVLAGALLLRAERN